VKLFAEAHGDALHRQQGFWRGGHDQQVTQVQEGHEVARAAQVALG
jgi:hypothetical protein